MYGISYWIFPLFSGIVWLAMLLAMLIYWEAKGHPHLASFNPGQHIAYISDVGAWNLKPLFIAMGTVTVVVLDLTFILERYLRHSGRLTYNTSQWQKILSLCSILASIVGAAGLILLTIFDDLHHSNLHDAFLVVFLAGYIVSAIFICWEYQRLGIHYRQHRILRISFWIKLFFVIVELGLAIAFGVTRDKDEYNAAAVIEWIIAFIFTFYVLSFAIDFLPALHTGKRHDHHDNETEIGMAENEAAAAESAHGRIDGGSSYTNSTAPTNGYTNGYGTPAAGYAAQTNGYANGTTNGYKPAVPVAPSSNF